MDNNDYRELIANLYDDPNITKKVKLERMVLLAYNLAQLVSEYRETLTFLEQENLRISISNFEYTDLDRN